jgi:hypothetical protein
VSENDSMYTLNGRGGAVLSIPIVAVLGFDEHQISDVGEVYCVSFGRATPQSSRVGVLDACKMVNIGSEDRS